MSTSGVYSATIGYKDLARMAMMVIRAKDGDETIDPQEYTDVLSVTNMLVSQWMGKADFAPGLKVWLRKRGYLFLSNSTNVYTMSPTATGWTNTFYSKTTTAAAAAGATTLTLSNITDVTVGSHIGIQQDDGSLFWTTIKTPLANPVTLSTALPTTSASGSVVYVYSAVAQYPVNIEAVVLRDVYGNDTQLIGPLTQRTYDNLPSKANPQYTGDPTAYYIEEQIGQTLLYTDVAVAQDVTKYLVVTYMEPSQKFVNTTDEPYYPEEWKLPLMWGIAEQIAPMFGATWTPKMEALKNNAIAIARNKTGEVTDMFFNSKD